MKLISTLRYGSTQGMPAGTGNYGGDLRLFFSTLNPADTKPGPIPDSVNWQGGGNGAYDTYKLPNNDVIAFNLDLPSPLPNQLYVFGTITITTAGITFGVMPIGQGGPSYAPGQQALGILSGRTQGPQGGKNFDVGFEIAVPWNGIMADCHGQWWAVWR
jgi:hypothetical protein